LVKKLDAAIADNKDAKMGSFVLLLTDDTEAMEKTLKDLAEKEKVAKVMLGIESPAGPGDLDISKDADVTVVLYKKKQVVKNLSFGKGKFDAKAVDAVVGELKSILPEKKDEKKDK
jgi:hypothetical protein